MGVGGGGGGCGAGDTFGAPMWKTGDITPLEANFCRLEIEKKGI